MIAVKDFIYLDTDRLNSLYSQVFKGVVEAILESELTEEESRDMQKGGIRSAGSTVEQRVAAASYRTESRVLHDYMYNLLEQKIASVITDITAASADNYYDLARDAFLTKVHGTAELWYFQRFKDYLDKNNNVGLALSYITSKQQREALEREKAELEQWLKTRSGSKRSPDYQQREARLNQIKQLLDPVAIARAMNLYVDPQYLQHISFLTNVFYADFIDIVIRPRGGSGNILIRGITEKRWFRRSPEILRLLNAGHNPSNWTMVAQVTHVPQPREETAIGGQSTVTDLTSDGTGRDGGIAAQTVAPGATSVDTAQGSNEQATTDMGLRDAYRNLFNAYQEIEKSFTESKNSIEIVVHPLAIYRESNIRDAGT